MLRISFLKNDAILPHLESSDAEKLLSDIIRLKAETEQVDLYKKALHIIPKRARDDGVFGLGLGRRQVSDRSYWVQGNLILVNYEDGTHSEIQIGSINVWLIHLSQNPSKLINLTVENDKLALARHRDIVDQYHYAPMTSVK